LSILIKTAAEPRLHNDSGIMTYRIGSIDVKVAINGYIKYDALGKWIKIATKKSAAMSLKRTHYYELIGCPKDGNVTIKGKDSTKLDIDFASTGEIEIKVNGVSTHTYDDCSDLGNIFPSE